MYISLKIDDFQCISGKFAVGVGVNLVLMCVCMLWQDLSWPGEAWRPWIYRASHMQGAYTHLIHHFVQTARLKRSGLQSVDFKVQENFKTPYQNLQLINYNNPYLMYFVKSIQY